MATIGSLSVSITATTTGLRKGLDKARGNLSRFRNSLGVTERQVKNFQRAIIAGGAAFAAWGVKLASQTEQAQVAFETMLKSGERASQLIDEIKSFAAATPFKKFDLIKSAQGLLAFGVEAEDVMDKMKLLGDLAAGSGARIQELTRIFGKVQAIGKSSLEQINQLAERGIPIYKALEQQTGLSGDALRKFISTGKVTAEVYTASLKSMASEGGIFFGAMEKQSQTLAGRLSTLGDNVEALAESLAKDLLPIISNAVKGSTAWIQENSELIKLTARVAVAMGAMALGYKAYTVAAGFASTATAVFTGLLNTLAAHPIVATLLAIAAAIKVTSDRINELSSMNEKMGKGKPAGFWEETFTLPGLNHIIHHTEELNKLNQTVEESIEGRETLARLEKQAVASRKLGERIGGATGRGVNQVVGGLTGLADKAGSNINALLGSPKEDSRSFFEKLQDRGKVAKAARESVAAKARERSEKQTAFLFGKQREKEQQPIVPAIGKFFGELSNKVFVATNDLAKRGVGASADLLGGQPAGQQSANLALEAASVEGFKALRANLGGTQDPQKKIAELAKKQLAEDKIANSWSSKIHGLLADSLSAVTSIPTG